MRFANALDEPGTGEHEMKPTLVCGLAVIAALGVAQSHAQSVVYSQPNDGINDGPYSDGVPGQYYNTRIADNFTLADPTLREITEITWWGCTEAMDFYHLENFEAWVIKIYHQDYLGLPSELIFDETFAKEDTNPVLTGNMHWEGGHEYEHHVQLSSPVTLYIDEPYWISIGADCIDPFAAAWIWSVNYNDGDSYSALDHLDGVYLARGGDLAFELWGESADGCPRAGCDLGDYNGDCVVELGDLAGLLAAFGACQGDPDYDPDADFNGDGCVELGDLAGLLSAFGVDCTY